MKPSRSFFGIKKIRLISIIALMAALFCVALLAIPTQEAEATAADQDDTVLSWNARVCYRETGKYIDLTTSAECMHKELVFLISGMRSGDGFYYHVADEMVTDFSGVSWERINDTTTIPTEINGTSYYLFDYDAESRLTGGVGNIYIYFRRTYSEPGQTPYEELYGTKRIVNENGVNKIVITPIFWYISININTGDDLGFYSITAKYLRKGETTYSAYRIDSGWTDKAVVFSVVTQTMYNNGGAELQYDRNKEMLSYSENFQTYYEEYYNSYRTNYSPIEAHEMALVDGAKRANWIAFSNGNNQVKLEKSLNGVVIWFRLTDITGGNGRYAYYSTEENGLGAREESAIPIYLDPESPSFNVSATTVNADSQEVTYSSGSWTSNPVQFVMIDTSKCISPITYRFSAAGGAYTNIGENRLTRAISTNPIRLQAVTSAGQTYDYPTGFIVRIDSVVPQIDTDGFTIDPDKELAGDECDKEMGYADKSFTDNSGVYVVRMYGQNADNDKMTFANDKIIIRVFNRTAVGDPIVNTSGVTFYYQEARERSQYTGSWQRMTDTKTDGNEQYYLYTLSIGAEVSLTRYVRFRIVSGAGIVSNEHEICVSISNSIFSFDLPEDYLIAQYNQDGWISDKAIIRAIVTVDRKVNPSTQYTFYYWTNELTSENESSGESLSTRIKKNAFSSVGTPVSFYEEVYGEIKWIYEFELKDASANSQFQLRAMNAAGKLSSFPRQTGIIYIDVAKPTYAWDAYLYPVTGEITESDLKNTDRIGDLLEEGKLLRIAFSGDERDQNAGWVNGPIWFVLSVNVGVSGISLKEMTYAKDSDGNALYDTGGNLVWQEVSKVKMADFHDANASGTVGGKYYYFFSLSNETSKAISSQEYRFRIYTGSGISQDVSFIANFDSTENIRLQTVNVTSATGRNNYAWSVSSGGSAVISSEDFSVSEDFSLTFSSSIDRANVENHYSLFYRRFRVEDMGSIGGAVPTNSELIAYAEGLGTELITGELTEGRIDTAIETGKKGVIYYALYVKSKSRDYKDISKQSGIYVLAIEYDTLAITISYGLNIPLSNSDTDEDDMDRGVWKTGTLEVTVGLRADNSGENIKATEGYTYYYKLIDFAPSETVLILLEEESTWIEVRNGQFNSEGQYIFEIPFTEKAFYGYIGLSVCNKAKYRSLERDSRKIIRIDNTTPDIMSIIQGKTEAGIVEERTVAFRRIISVNTKDEILLQMGAESSSENHADIRFFYKLLDDIPSDQSSIYYSTSTDMMELSDRDSGGVRIFALNGNFNEKKFSTVYLMIFAINEVATSTTGFSGSTGYGSDENGYSVLLSTIYEFNYDPSELSSTAITAGDGADWNNGMYEFLWQKEVSISLTVKSSERKEAQNYYRFMFSVDSGATWFDYLEAGSVNYYTSDELKELSFTAESLAEYVNKDGRPFENGVMKTFLFRAVNKAGAYVDCGNIYIAIDETIPEFNVEMYDHNGLVYIGGNTNNLVDGEKNWTNGPVTLKINVTKTPASGIRLYYVLHYLTNGRMDSAFDSYNGGKGKEILNYEQFSTDRLDGFNINRDAIIELSAISRSGAVDVGVFRVNVRVSVDQQVPIFTLIGRASQQDDSGASNGIERIISSGEWTGLNTVSVSKEISVTNVSNVVYTYTWQSTEVTEPTQYTWSSTEASISRKETGKLIVTATSADGNASKGKTYTVEFDINIDTDPPWIEFSGDINVIEGSEQYIDLQVIVRGDNLDIVEYITVKEDTRGFTFDPEGYVLSTSSVDNSQRHAADELDPNVFYRGYVHIYIRDKAGHEVHFELYVVPFPLTVNTIELTDKDKTMVNELERTLELAKRAGYMDPSREQYFDNLISRLRDRMETLQTEIDGYRDYLEKLANRSSFELKSDYAEMLRYRTTFQNYEVYGQKWIQDAITGDSTSNYYAYYKNFLNQFDKLHAQMEQVERVETDVTELPAINMVEAEDYTDILRVYDEYSDLTQDQRTCFTPNLYNKLMDLKEACEVLLLSDKETGVVIDGDFAPGATVAVTSYSENTDTYQNAQTLLINSIDETQPRAIVSIYRVALTGAYAQTAASGIKVNLPIPEEYRSYIAFSVYALNDDGSMKKVSGTEIQPDGASVAFSTESLGTYVLCVRADIQETETNTDSYGNIFGIPLTATMIKYLAYIGGALLAVMFLVFIIMGIRQRRFMNTYNRSYRNSIYRKQSKGVPKGNKF